MYSAYHVVFRFGEELSKKNNKHQGVWRLFQGYGGYTVGTVDGSQLMYPRYPQHS